MGAKRYTEELFYNPKHGDMATATGFRRWSMKSSISRGSPVSRKSGLIQPAKAVLDVLPPPPPPHPIRIPAIAALKTTPFRFILCFLLVKDFLYSEYLRTSSSLLPL